MLDLTQLGDWRPPIVDTVASSGDGVDDLWTAIDEHRVHLESNGDLARFRRERLAREFHQILLARVEHHLDTLMAADRFAPLVADMSDGTLDPYEAADRLLAGLLPDA
jgi:LAO/AO transport system kinase